MTVNAFNLTQDMTKCDPGSCGNLTIRTSGDVDILCEIGHQHTRERYMYIDMI